MSKFQKLISCATVLVSFTIAPHVLAATGATLLVNGKKSVTVIPGESLNFTWQLDGVAVATSTYKMNKPDTCAGGGEGTRKGPLPWVATTGQGATTASVQRCQGGVSYTMTIEGKTADGKKRKASAKVKVLAPILLANGVKKLAVSPGQSIAYLWVAPEGVTPSSYYTVNRTDKCGIEKGKRYPWIATSGQGSESAVAEACQSGSTYKIVYQYSDSRGRAKKVSIQVKVN